jgi:hypothetical protein
VRHHAHISVGVEIARRAHEQQLAHIADVFGAADRRAARHAHFAVFNRFVAEQAGILQSLLRRIHAKLRHAPHAAELLARPMRGRGVIGQRRAKLGFQFGKPPVPIHLFHGVFSGFEGSLNARPVAPEGGNAADAGNHNTLGFHQHKPPFTAITWRVIYAAFSSIRKRTACATSSGVPIRAAGTAFRISSTGTFSFTISVSISPGATQFTVILRFASSTANAFAAPMMPALDAL